MENLNKAISAFDSWHTPWAFSEEISSNEIISESERELFQTVLDEATSEKYWAYPEASETLSECYKNVRKSLNAQYSFLSEKSAEQIAKWASYQWR